jgi:tetratricopeptide (TPR) repeat protein
MLSGLYAAPRKEENAEEVIWFPDNKYIAEMDRKFRDAAECAMEEFKILNDYAPHDPWVHAQLAYSYHDLQMYQEEIAEYEIIFKLCPDDKETMFKLGMLYFQQGLNAKGLRIYEELKRSHYKKAENLIKYYGSGLK